MQNAPRTPVVPEPLQGNTPTVDGQVIEVRGTTGELAHRPYVWIPSIKAVVGNIAIFGNLHVWTADTQKASERQAWTAWPGGRRPAKRCACPGRSAGGR